MTTETPKPVFSVALEAMAGSSPEHLAQHAQRIADQLGVMAEYDFNGVRCIAWPGGSAQKLHENTISCLDRMANHAHLKNQVAMS